MLTLKTIQEKRIRYWLIRVDFKLVFIKFLSIIQKKKVWLKMPVVEF